ncbi:MAG: hypothetical protein Q9201_005875 [Fulgogasparrea decipioides]
MDSNLFEEKLAEQRKRDWEEIARCQNIAKQHGAERVTCPEPLFQAPELAVADEALRNLTTGTDRRRPPQTCKLLSFPAEVKLLILSYAAGRQILHIDHAPSLKRRHKRSCPNPAVCHVGRGPEFYVGACAAQVSERTAWKEFWTQSRVVPEDDDQDYYVADAHLRHNHCRPWQHQNFVCASSATLVPDRHLMAAFTVCRELAIHAFETFWQTNTFAFGETASFGRFLSRLSTSQLRSIRKLNIICPHQIPPQPGDFDPSRLVNIERLDTLDLSIHGDMLDENTNFFSAEPENRWADEVDIRKTYAGYFLRLEVLDVKQLRIIIFDSEHDHPYDPQYHNSEADRFNMRYTLEEKRILAKLMKSILMCPAEEREKLAAEDRRIYEMENLLKGLKYAQDVHWQVQREDLRERLDDLPDEAISNNEEPTEEPSAEESSTMDHDSSNEPAEGH